MSCPVLSLFLSLARSGEKGQSHEKGYAHQTIQCELTHEKQRQGGEGPGKFRDFLGYGTSVSCWEIRQSEREKRMNECKRFYRLQPTSQPTSQPASNGGSSMKLWPQHNRLAIAGDRVKAWGIITLLKRLARQSRGSPIATTAAQQQ